MLARVVRLNVYKSAETFKRCNARDSNPLALQRFNS